MSTQVFQCPCCNAPLAYSGESGKLECAACGNSFEPDAIRAMVVEDQSDIRFENTSQQFGEDEASSMSAFICKNCGAELITEATTTATECPYCGSPTVLPSQIESGVRPEIVVPFKLTKEQAIELFEGYFKGKLLMPNIFLKTRNRIAEIKKLYVPYWLFDCDADGDVSFNATKVRSRRSGDYEVTTTDHYLLRRSGSLGFNSIPVDSSEKMDDRISESIEPYELSSSVPFQPAVLAGALADRADVGMERCKARAIERVEQSVVDTFRSTAIGYTTVSLRNKNIVSHNGRATAALMPVWYITTEKEIKGEKKIFTFAINGQTGELTTDVQPDRKKTFFWRTGLLLGFATVGFFLVAALGAMGVIK